PSIEKNGNRTANFGGSQYLITESSNQKEIAFEFLKGLTTSDEVQKIQINQAIFPAMTTEYESEIFTDNVEYFEEPIWNLFAEQMREIKPFNYTANFTIAKDEIANIQQRIFDGTSIEDSVKMGQNRVE